MISILLFMTFFIFGLFIHHSLIRSISYVLMLLIPWGGVLGEYITLASLHPILAMIFGHFVSEKRYNFYLHKTVLLRTFLIFLFITATTILSQINYHILAREMIHSFFLLIALAFILSDDRTHFYIKPTGNFIFIVLYYVKILIYYAFIHDTFAPAAGQFIKEEHSTYSDFSMWIIILIILNTHRPYSILPFVIFFPAIIISGSDTIVFLYVILGVFLIFGNYSKLLVFSCIFLFACFGIFIVADNISYFLAIMASRNYPLLVLIEEGMSLRTLLGTGFGVGIEIPWFTAVPGLGNKAVFYDNMYGTIFIKFGLVGCIALAIFLLKVRDQSVFLCVVLVVAGLAGSVFYQNSFIFALYLVSIMLKRGDQRLV